MQSITIDFRPPIPEWMKIIADGCNIDDLSVCYHDSLGDERAYYGALIAVKLGGLTFDLLAANRWHEQEATS